MGGSITLTRDVGSFFAMDIDIPCNVNIEYGDSLTFSITAQENIIADISSLVSNQTLNIEFIQTPHEYNPIQLNFTMPDFRGLSISDICKTKISSSFESSSRMRFEITGSGTLNFSDTIKCYEFRLENSEGDVELNMAYLSCEKLSINTSANTLATVAGEAAITNLNISEEGKLNSLDGFNFPSNKTYIDIEGIAEDLQISVLDELYVSGDGSGTITYKGTPHTIHDTSGANIELIPTSK